MAARTGSSKIWWREKMRKIKREKRQDQEVKYFFQHVPKTAGTSFRYQLYRVFSQKEIFPNLADLQANDGRYVPFRKLKTLDTEFFADKNLLMGHLPWHAGQRLFGVRPKHLLFLRDPIERMVSLFHHMKNLNAPPGATDEEVLKLINHHNQQTRIIAGPGIKGPINNDHVAKVKIRLNQVEFIGITERYAESISLVNKIFQWDLGNPILLNSRKNPGEEIDPDVMKILVEKNQLDYEIYEFAKERFSNLQRKFGD